MKVDVKKRIVKVDDIYKLYPVFSKTTMRWLIASNNHGRNPGLECCLIRIGKREGKRAHIYVDLDAFEKWLDDQRGDFTPEFNDIEDDIFVPVKKRSARTK